MASPLTMNFTCFDEREDILHSRSPAAHCSRVCLRQYPFFLTSKWRLFLAIFFPPKCRRGKKANSLFLIFANYGGKTGSRNTSRLASSPASQELCDVTQRFHDQTTAEFSNSSTEKLERSKEQKVRNRIPFTLVTGVLVRDRDNIHYPCLHT
ncbi:hypothetical protein CDAR_95251 [Caerostris darwini]|uniref:Uncharacterized protein n=1 Tax=Caerostris darwini TaxID=1538125 RepID=A0AAV4PMH4_9ARAC|nr:hypothetical protein CDAR_95251 [Caerostris darwini]